LCEIKNGPSLLLYRATQKNLNHSFLSHTLLPHNATRKRGLCRRPMSVCPSVTFVYCIHTAEDIVKLLSWPGSPSFYLSDPERRYPTPRRNPSAGRKSTRQIKSHLLHSGSHEAGLVTRWH